MAASMPSTLLYQEPTSPWYCEALELTFSKESRRSFYSLRMRPRIASSGVSSSEKRLWGLGLPGIVRNRMVSLASSISFPAVRSILVNSCCKPTMYEDQSLDGGRFARCYQHGYYLLVRCRCPREVHVAYRDCCLIPQRAIQKAGWRHGQFAGREV